jgi:hypothetical protein
MGQRLVVNLQRLHLRRQLDPQEVAAGRARGTRTGRKVLTDCLDERN